MRRILQILKLSAPLILSTTGLMVMQFIDALFLSWYSPEAIAAMVPSGMATYLIISPFQATANYTATFVSQYVGAEKIDRAFSATWQGIYFSLLAGFLVFFVGFGGDMLFKLAGHAPEVAKLEAEYFKILCWGALFFLITNALSGYFAGRGKTGIVMIVNLMGFALNTPLAYFMIFGMKGYFPEMGISGAAYATILSQAFVSVLLVILFIREKSAGKHWGIDVPLFWRLIRFGFPAGIRWGFEMLAWTFFLFVIGRIGTIELAATNIAFRINGFAFFPIVGLSQAVAVLVGQAQGRHDPQESVRITYAGLWISEIWMLISAFIFILFPEQIYLVFRGDMADKGSYEAILETGKILLRFVALYTLFDAFNIIITAALQAAGDTRWTMIFGLIANICFFFLLILADLFKTGLWSEWILATFFVILTSIVWFFRFHSGKWKMIQVIEPVS